MTGFLLPTSLLSGIKVARELLSLSCFVTEIPVLERLILGMHSCHSQRARARLNSINNSSLVIDKVTGPADEGPITVACVYCDFYAQNEQSTTGLLGALLKQIVCSSEPIPEEVESAFMKSKRRVGGCRLLIPDIQEMLFKTLSRLRTVFICIDALDEFPAKHRPELWESLRQIIRKCPNTRLFLTGRLHIRDEVQEYFLGTAEMLLISPRERDIKLYLKIRLRRDPEPYARDQALETDILRIVPEVISEVYVFSRYIEFSS